METTTIAGTERRTLMKELSPILDTIKWGDLSREYIGKSNSWMYNKLLGRPVGGSPGGFTPAEVEQLRDALLAFSRRVGETALAL